MNHITPENPLNIYKIDDYVPFVMKAEAIEPGEPAQLMEFETPTYGFCLFINIHPLNVVNESEEEAVEVRRLIIRVLEDIYIPYIEENQGITFEDTAAALEHYLMQCSRTVNALEMTTNHVS